MSCGHKTREEVLCTKYECTQWMYTRCAADAAVHISAVGVLRLRSFAVHSSQCTVSQCAARFKLAFSRYIAIKWATL